MIKEVKMRYNFGNYLDGSYIINKEEDLTLVFLYDKPKNCKMYFKADNGFKTIKDEVIDNKICLSKNFIKAGVLKIQLYLEVKGEIVKTFLIEDLVIKEINDIVQMTPRMLEIENKVVELDKKVEEIKNQLDFFIKLWKEGL